MFLAIVAKGDVVPPTLVDLVPQIASQALPFRGTPSRSEATFPESGRLVIYAWDNDVEATSGKHLIHVNGRTAVTLSGHVSHLDIPDGRDVESVVRTIAINERTVRHLSGSYALLKADSVRGTVNVWNTVTRIVPVYWAETDEAVLVGTRALLISCLLAGRAWPEYELKHVVPFLVRGFCPNEKTVYRGVNILPPNAELIASGAGVGIVPIDDFDLRCGRTLPSDRHYDEIANLLISSVSGLRDKSVVCDITGGKDSRLVTAALHRAGVPFVARTGGFAEAPDVVIGKQVAEALGVEHVHEIPDTVKRGGESMMKVDLHERARRTLIGADGMLTAYENVGGNRAFSPSPVRLGGAGGESLRGGFAKLLSLRSDVTWESSREFLLNRYIYPVDLFDPDALADQRQFLEDWIVSEQARNTPAPVALDKFYLYYRTGRWAAATRSCQYGSYSLSPLLDNLVTKAGLELQASPKLSEVVAFEVMRRLAPQLVEIPFAEFRWGFEAKGPAPGQEDDWLARAPLLAERGTRAGFNWRFTWTTDLFDAFHDQLLGDRRSEALFDVVDRKALRRRLLKAKGTAPTVRTTLLFWALFTGSVLLSNQWLVDDLPRCEVKVHVPPVPDSLPPRSHGTA
jgi:hypothetical protein